MTDLERAKVEATLRQISRLYERAAAAMGGGRGDGTASERRALEQIETARRLGAELPEGWR